MSIKVRAQLQVGTTAFQQMPVEITLHGSLEDFESYYTNVRPSYAVGHRLHEAIGALLAKLRAGSETVVEVEQ